MKNKINSGFDFQDEYIVLEISTLLPDYGLCYRLNKNMRFGLHRLKDLRVYQARNKEDVLYSLYNWSPNRHHDYFLISEVGQYSVLMPSYYLLLKGIFTKDNVNSMIDQISCLDQVISCHELRYTKNTGASMRKLFNQMNFIINDLEYHLIELQKKNSAKTSYKGKPRKKITLN